MTGVHVSNIIALRSVATGSLVDGEDAIVRGYYATGDSGGGTFYWDASSTVADNGGTVIAPGVGGSGRWRRLCSGSVSVHWFGAKGDGTTNDRPRIQATIDFVRAQGGGSVLFEGRTYLVQAVPSLDDRANGLLIAYTSQESPANRINLIGAGRSTVLKAGSPNMRIIRLSDSRCAIESLQIDGDRLANVHGLAIVPENTMQASTLVYQQKNHLRQLEIRGCTEAIEMKSGPRVGAMDSGCWLNRFYDVDIYNCARGIWMRSGPNAGSSQCNRNSFHGIRIGQAVNTGIQIDAGHGNNFHSCELEGIETGSSPNTTPTAIKLVAADEWGHGNESNRFFGGVIEACTRDVENANAYTEMFGLYFDWSKSQMTAVPAHIVGGYGISGVPVAHGGGDYGLIVQANGQIGTLGSGVIAGSVVMKVGGVQQRRQPTGVAAANAPNIDHGGFTATTGPGGGSVSQGFLHPYSPGAAWLASTAGVCASNPNRNATRVSIFREQASGAFEEFNLVDHNASVATSAMALARSGNTVTLTATMFGGIGIEALDMKLNLVRLH